MNSEFISPLDESEKYDALRGISSIVVLAAHLGEVFWWRLIGSDHWVSIVGGMAARHAVLVFFLLSGFLITESIRQNMVKNGCFRSTDFITSRVARIYPPLLGAILLVLVLWSVVQVFGLPGSTSIPLSLPGDIDVARTSLSVTPMDITKAVFVVGGMTGFDSPLWSLYIEWKLYFIAMGIVIAASAAMSGRARIVGLALILVLAVRGFRSYEFLLCSCVWFLGAGMNLLSDHRRWKGWYWILGLSLAAILAAAFERPDLFLIGPSVGQLAAQFGCAFAYAVLIFYLPWSASHFRIFVKSGRFSYSLYILHYPILLFALSLSLTWLDHSKSRTALLTVSLFVVAIAVAKMFAHFLERHHYFRKILRLAWSSGLHRFQRVRPPFISKSATEDQNRPVPTAD